MKEYQHLNIDEREKIRVGLVQGLSYREIGRQLGRDHRTIGGEIKRNAGYFQPYIAWKAQRKADRRGCKQRWKAPLKGPEIFLYVREKLRLGWSPETIEGRLKLEYGVKKVDDDTIYRYIYKRENRRYKFWEKLTLGRRKRMKKGSRRVRLSKIPRAISIDLRPEIVNQRSNPGHWESDLMEGQRSGPVISTTVERLARYVRLSKLRNKTAQSKVDSLNLQLRWLPERLRQTLTVDNGSENTNHPQVSSDLNMDIYFCHAYHAWEKGTVENTIKRLRRYIPKGTDLTEVSTRELILIENHFNHTPRKCLGYLTPYEKMMAYLNSTS